MTTRNREELKNQILTFTFDSQSIGLIKRLVTSCPSKDSCLYLPLISTDCNLLKFGEYLPSAYETILNYFMSKQNICNDKKIITYENILKAFGSDEHLTVISRTMYIIKNKKIPLLFTDPSMTGREFEYSHLIKIMKIKKVNRLLVGHHDGGGEVMGLYVPGSKDREKKLLEGHFWGVVHFATIIDLVDEKLKNKIEIMQKKSQNVGHLLFEETKKTKINYSIKHIPDNSTLSLTKKRFKI